MSQQREESDSDRSVCPESNREFVFFDKMDDGRRSQYLSMKTWTVHKDVRNQNGKLIPALLKRRPVNKKLNNGRNFASEDDVLDLLFKRNNVDFKEVRMREISALNKFYEKSSEEISTNGSVRTKESSLYCKIPKIQFKATQDTAKIFASSESEYRYKQLQLIARSFINRGYGFTAFHADVAEHPSEVTVEDFRYRNLLGTVLTESFRRVETFVIEQCCMDLRRVNRAELKLLFIVLLNIRNYFTPLDCETMLNYVKLCYHLGDVTITAEASVKLMHAIQDALKKRIYERTGEVHSDEAYHSGNEIMWTSKGGYTNEKLQLHRIWNGELERLLVESYRKEPDMNRIARHFRKTYPKKQQFFTPESLKGRLNRTLRESIKKVQFLRESEGHERMPQLVKIFKPTFRAILDSPQLYKLRTNLLEVNVSENCNPKLLYKTIEGLNESTITWETIQREEQHQKYQASCLSLLNNESDIQIDLEISQLLAFEQ